MSLVRVDRKKNVTGDRRRNQQPVRNKKFSKSKPPWDDTVSDLQVHRPSQEEIQRRKEVHQSAHADAMRLEKLQRMIERRNRMDNSPSMQQRKVAILKEVFYEQEQEQLSDVLSRSDKTLAMVNDLFGDFAAKYAAVPNVTLAPRSDTDRIHIEPPVPITEELPSRLESLSESMMDQYALNDRAYSDTEDTENIPPVSAQFNSELDLNRFKQFLEQERTDGGPHFPIGPMASSVLAQKMLAALAKERIGDPKTMTETPVRPGERTPVKEGSFIGEPPDTVARILARSPHFVNVINDTGKVKRTKQKTSPPPRQQGSVQCLTDSTVSTTGNLDDIRTVIDGLENEISEYERVTGRQGPPHSQRDDIHRQGSDNTGLTGYTGKLLNGLTRLTHYVKESEIQLRAESEIRQHVLEEISQLRLLVDALTTDIVNTQEDFIDLKQEYLNFKINTEHQLNFLMAQGGFSTSSQQQQQQPQQQQQQQQPQQQQIPMNGFSSQPQALLPVSSLPDSVHTQTVSQQSNIPVAVMLSPPKQCHSTTTTTQHIPNQESVDMKQIIQHMKPAKLQDMQNVALRQQLRMRAVQTQSVPQPATATTTQSTSSQINGLPVPVPSGPLPIDQITNGVVMIPSGYMVHPTQQPVVTGIPGQQPVVTGTRPTQQPVVSRVQQPVVTVGAVPKQQHVVTGIPGQQPGTRHKQPPVIPGTRPKQQPVVTVGAVLGQQPVATSGAIPKQPLKHHTGSAFTAVESRKPGPPPQPVPHQPITGPRPSADVIIPALRQTTEVSVVSQDPLNTHHYLIQQAAGSQALSLGQPSDAGTPSLANQIQDLSNQHNEALQRLKLLQTVQHELNQIPSPTGSGLNDSTLGKLQFSQHVAALSLQHAEAQQRLQDLLQLQDRESQSPPSQQQQQQQKQLLLLQHQQQQQLLQQQLHSKPVVGKISPSISPIPLDFSEPSRENTPKKPDRPTSVREITVTLPNTEIDRSLNSTSTPSVAVRTTASRPAEVMVTKVMAQSPGDSPLSHTPHHTRAGPAATGGGSLALTAHM